MKIGGYQMPVSSEIFENVHNIKKAIDWAVGESVDVLLTPECALSGYAWRAQHALDHRLKYLPGALSEVVGYANEKNIDLVLGTGIYEDDTFEFAENKKWFNQQRFYSKGEVIHKHNKILLTFDEPYDRGSELTTFIYKDRITCGLICNDLWACGFQVPNDAGRLAKEMYNKGVQLCFLSSSAPKISNDPDYFYTWNKIHVESYSRQGKYVIAVADNCNSQTGSYYSGKTGAPSGIMDPIKGWVTLTASNNEQYFSWHWE